MPVVSALSPVSLSSYFDPNTGAVLHVDLYFYKGDTLDPLPVYADAALSVQHPQPLPTTGYGRVPPVFIGKLPDPGYRVRVFNQYSELVEDLDNLPGAVVPDGGGGGGGPVQPDDVHLLKTGDYVFAARNATPRGGCVLANGLTLGSSTSTATGRANNDAHDLFVLLWGSDEYGLLPVLPSRGASAEGDWLANKVITLPDLQCTVLIGMDAMGVAATNRLANVPMTAGTPNRVFARGGTALETLTAAMIPAHTHPVTDPGHTHGVTIPGHTHTFSDGATSFTGSHQHTGGTDNAGAHSHTYSIATGGTSYQAGVSAAAFNSYNSTNTGVDGVHSHSFTTNAAGGHAHSVTGNISAYGGASNNSGSSTTGLTVGASTGGGGAHNNTPLFTTASIYLVL